MRKLRFLTKYKYGSQKNQDDMKVDMPQPYGLNTKIIVFSR